MPRIYTYKGKNPDELKALTMPEFLKILDSRQRRSVKRMGLEYKLLVAKAEEIRKSGKDKVVRTTARAAVILPAWLGMRFAVHNGKDWKEFVIVPEMIGHRLGEFSFSTKRVLHSAPGIRATRGSKFLAVK